MGGMGGGDQSAMMASMMKSMAGMGGMMGAMGAQGKEAEKRRVTLTRTDFLIQFVWQPPKPEEQPKTEEERAEKVAEITKQMVEAQKNSSVITMRKE